jgi:dethiobiotin synthetase
LNTLLIAGTDAQVGKTIVITALAAYWQRYCEPRRLGVIKLIESQADPSTELDGDRLIHLFNLDQSAQIAPVTPQTAVLPSIAAQREGAVIELETVWQQLQQLQQQQDFVLLETWGGLGSPLTFETTIADLAWDWQIPAVLVVPVQPGAVAQAVANVALARQTHVHLKGIILNAVQPCRPQDWQDWVPVDLLQALTRKPVLGCIPYLEDPSNVDKLVQVAAECELERLLPDLESIVWQESC